MQEVYKVDHFTASMDKNPYGGFRFFHKEEVP